MYFLEKQDFDSLHIWKFQFENLRESISKISALYLKLFPIWTIFIEIISNIVKFEATNWISIYRNNFQWLNLRNRLRLCYHSATGSGSLVILPRCWIAASCQSRTPNQPTISSLNHLSSTPKKNQPWRIQRVSSIAVYHERFCFLSFPPPNNICSNNNQDNRDGTS